VDDRVLVPDALYDSISQVVVIEETADFVDQVEDDEAEYEETHEYDPYKQRTEYGRSRVDRHGSPDSEEQQYEESVHGRHRDENGSGCHRIEPSQEEQGHEENEEKEE